MNPVKIRWSAVLALLLVAMSFTGAKAQNRDARIAAWDGLEQKLSLTEAQRPLFENLVQAHLAAYSERRQEYRDQAMKVLTPAQISYIQAAQAKAMSENDPQAVRQAWKDAVPGMQLTDAQREALRYIHRQAMMDEAAQRDRFVTDMKAILSPQQCVVFDSFMTDRRQQWASSQK